MNRTMKCIDPDKWYHEKTIFKYCRNSKLTYHFSEKQNLDGKEFTFLILLNGFRTVTHLVRHPKTKRFRVVSYESYKEIGF